MLSQSKIPTVLLCENWHTNPKIHGVGVKFKNKFGENEFREGVLLYNNISSI